MADRDAAADRAAVDELAKQFTPMTAQAGVLYDMFLSFRRGGFSEYQSLVLLAHMLRAHPEPPVPQ